MKHTRGRDGSRSAADWNRLASLYREKIAWLVATGPINLSAMYDKIRGDANKSFNREFNVDDLRSVLWKLCYSIDRGGIVRKKSAREPLDAPPDPGAGT